MMKIAIQCALRMFILVVSVKGQQIGIADLTSPPAQDKLSQRQRSPLPPQGCKELGGGIVDGGFPIKNPPHEITLEVTSVSNDEHTIGSAMQAEVQLRNSGVDPIKIPWNADPNAVKGTQNPNDLAWEDGSFHVLLGHGDLKNLGQSLYGSKFSKGSIIAIQPGEWIKALIKFQLELEQPYPGHFVMSGTGQLRVEWEQASHREKLDFKECKQWSSSVTYRNYYHQQNLAVTINITRSRSTVR